MRINRDRFYKRLIEYHHAHPEVNNADIGRIFKCTRERVRQILRDHDTEAIKVEGKQ